MFDKEKHQHTPFSFTFSLKDHFKCQRISIACEKDGKWPLDFINILTSTVSVSYLSHNREKTANKMATGRKFDRPGSCFSISGYLAFNEDGLQPIFDEPKEEDTNVENDFQKRLKPAKKTRV